MQQQCAVLGLFLCRWADDRRRPAIGPVRSGCKWPIRCARSLWIVRSCTDRTFCCSPDPIFSTCKLGDKQRPYLAYYPVYRPSHEVEYEQHLHTRPTTMQDGRHRVSKRQKAVAVALVATPRLYLLYIIAENGRNPPFPRAHVHPCRKSLSSAQAISFASAIWSCIR